MDDYAETPHVKWGKNHDKSTPRKPDHKHEYIKPSYWAKVRRFDGSISDRKYLFSLACYCVECGHIKTRPRAGTYTVIEVSVSEAHAIRDALRN
jgi:hypothetical protein